MPLPRASPRRARTAGRKLCPGPPSPSACSKRLGDFELDAAWSPQARRLAILGPSGSGKSLTLRLLAGLERPDSGWVRAGAADLTKVPPERRGVAYVPQGYGLLPDRSVRGQLRLVAGATPAEAEAWIGRLGLSGLEERRPAELSLGQQQRVALARALLRPAGLVLLDEPFSALDAPLRIQLRRNMRELQRRIAATTIIVTHDPEEAMLLADEIMLMDAGRVLQAGPTGQVAANPVSARAASLLGLDLLDGMIAEDGRMAIGGGICLPVPGRSLAAGQRVVWSLRREFVRLFSMDGDLANTCDADDLRTTYPGTVEDTHAVAGGIAATVRLGGAQVRALLEPGTPPPPGPCRVGIGAHAIQVWPCLPDGSGGRGGEVSPG